jgi:rare lipoprotein A
MSIQSFLIFLMISLSKPSIEEVRAYLEKPQVGIASYYAPKFNGRKTYFGEIFSNQELTAAHPTLPYNTLLEVTNLANNKKVTVRVNDRGPYTKSRVIDLSKSAAKEIGMVASGVAKVMVKVIGVDGLVMLDPQPEQTKPR